MLSSYRDEKEKYMIRMLRFDFCQAQLSSLKPQLKMNFSFIPNISQCPPPHPPPPNWESLLSSIVPIYSKLQLSQAFSSGHSCQQEQ